MAWEEYSGPSGKYLYYFKWKGQRRKKVVKTHQEGKEWEAAEKKRITEELARPRNPDLMFSVACNVYLQHCSINQGENTIREKLAYYRELAQFVGQDFPLKGIELEHVRRYQVHVHGEHGSKGTNRRFQKIAALWNYWRKEEKITGNPWSLVDDLAEEEAIKAVPTPQEVASILLASQGWQRDFLELSLKTAARPGELRKLRWQDVNFERRVIILWTRKRKGGRKESRPIPLGDTLHEILSRRWRERIAGQEFVFINPLSGKPWERNDRPFKFMMERLCERAGVERYTIYALRHYVAQRIMDSGKASPFDTQRLLGHQRLSTTDIYLKSLVPDLGRLAELLESETKVPISGTHEEGPEQFLGGTVGA